MSTEHKHEHHPIETLKEHLPHRHRDDAEGEGGNHFDPNDPPPVEGYNSYTAHELNVQLHHYTQAELEQIEEYERTHQNRKAVLDKIHYMRSREPWEGYDEMTMEEVLDRLESSDIETVKHVRDYERKFQNRPSVIEAAHELHHKLLSEHPLPPLPGWRPGAGANEQEPTAG